MCIFSIFLFLADIGLLISAMCLFARVCQLRQQIDGVIKRVAENRKDFDALIRQNFDVTEKAVLIENFFAESFSEVRKFYTPKKKDGKPKQSKPISPKQPPPLRKG